MNSNEKFEREFEAFLDEENSRLAALYRKLPRSEPHARLDAAVHAMAHRALNPQLVATPRAASERRRVARWVPALGAAAGVVLAAGIAFRLGPSTNEAGYRDAAPETDVISVRPLDAPPPAAPPLSPAPATAESAPSASVARAQAAQVEATPAPAAAPSEAQTAAKSKAAAVEEREQAMLPTPQPEQQPTAPAGAVGAAAAARALPAPRSFPAEERALRRPAEMDAVERKQIMAAGAWQNLHDQDAQKAAEEENRQRSLDDKADAGAATAPARNRPPASSELAAPMITPAAPAMAAPVAAPPQAAGSSRRDEPVGQSETGALKKERLRSADPNARLYPESWLAKVREMLKDGRRAEALHSLGEFRRLYPQYELPDDLRDLK